MLEGSRNQRLGIVVVFNCLFDKNLLSLESRKILVGGGNEKTFGIISSPNLKNCGLIERLVDYQLCEKDVDGMIGKECVLHAGASFFENLEFLKVLKLSNGLAGLRPTQSSFLKLSEQNDENISEFLAHMTFDQLDSKTFLSLSQKQMLPFRALAKHLSVTPKFSTDRFSKIVDSILFKHPRSLLKQQYQGKSPLYYLVYNTCHKNILKLLLSSASRGISQDL